MRAGSTLQYQLALELAARRGPCVGLGFATPERFARLLAEHDDDERILVVKTHAFLPAAADLIRAQQAVGIYAYRDVRDVLLSLGAMSEKSIIELLNEGTLYALLDWHDRWSSVPGMLVGRYEDLIDDLPAEVANISRLLGLTLTSDEAAKLADGFTLDRQRERIANYSNQAGSAGDSNGRFDPRTLLHRNHIRSGRPGDWRDELTKSEVALIERVAADWLTRYGYVLAAPRWRRALVAAKSPPARRLGGASNRASQDDHARSNSSSLSLGATRAVTSYGTAMSVAANHKPLKERILSLFNAPLGALGVELVPAWRRRWWMCQRTFEYGGRELPYFYHAYNCGWPPYTSERTVELALADDWLERQMGQRVVEVGAVTPYYWPGRVGEVVDPFDPHPRVTRRCSLIDVDLRGAHVLSISTFEHIGTGDYASQESPERINESVAKLLAEAPEFLVTMPTGYNCRVDELLFDDGNWPRDVSVGFLVRMPDGSWQQTTDPARARRPYGDPRLQRRFPETCIGHWANAVAVLERTAQRDVTISTNSSGHQS